MPEVLSMNEPLYHLAIGGQQHAALTAAQVRAALAANPALASGALVWTDAWDDWRPPSAMSTGTVRRWARSVGARTAGIGAGIVGASTVIVLLGSYLLRGPGPDALAEDLLPVLTDYAATLRAGECAELLRNRDEFRAAKPFEVEKKPDSDVLCRVVARGKASGSAPGGFLLEVGSCHSLAKDLADGSSRHEGNLNSKIGLSCGEGQVPTLVPDKSVELRVRALLREHLPDAVKRVAEGTISSDFARCYFQAKERASATYREEQNLRCEVLTADMNAPGITYDAMWRHASIYDDLEAYEREHKEAWDEAASNETLPSMFDASTAEMKAKACAAGDAASTDYEAQKMAVDTALRACL